MSEAKVTIEDLCKRHKVNPLVASRITDIHTLSTNAEKQSELIKKNHNTRNWNELSIQSRLDIIRNWI